MKIGVLILCYNNETDLNEQMIEELSAVAKNIKFCFVNNGSTDSTIDRLQILKEEIESDITIIDIKINKGEALAIKAGVRYFFNKINLQYIGYINFKNFNQKLDFNPLFDLILDSKNELIAYNSMPVRSRKVKRLLIKNVFSLTDFFEYLKIDLKKENLKTIA